MKPLFYKFAQLKIVSCNFFAIFTIKSVASVTFDNAFAVHDVKVIEGPEKLFVAMPSRRTPDGEYRDIAHPINSDMRNMLESKVLAAYDAIEDEPAPETAE